MKNIDKIQKRITIVPLVAGICIMGLVMASGSIFADMRLFPAENDSKEETQNISKEATYKGELSLDSKEYTFGVDALTGEILTLETGNKSASATLSKAPDAVSSATTKALDATKDLPSNPTSSTTPKEVAVTPTKTVDTVSSATPKSKGSTVAAPVDLSIYITEAAVRTIVLAKVPGATITEIHLEFDDSGVDYEVEMYLDNTEYEFEIDAITGKILEQESENASIDDDDDDDEDDDKDDSDDDDRDDADEVDED